MQRIAVWKTGHEIADRVAKSLMNGIPESVLYNTYGGFSHNNAPKKNISIGYGILRGMDEVFKNASIDWFNLDRGYFSPSHYDGYYRISYKGTQAKYDSSFNIVSDYLLDSGMGAIPALEPIRKYDKTKPVLVCPPTDAVTKFFNKEHWLLRESALFDIANVGKRPRREKSIRQKGDQSPIPWDDISAVVTFNSSVGWQAIQRGIPCLSDTTNSVVGSYYNTNSLDELIELFHSKPRKPLFDFMKAHQFTLSEIEKGLAWPLINHYLSLSDGIQGKRSAQMLPLTQSGVGLKNHFQSVT